MSYNFYKILHLTAIFVIFLSLGAAVVRSVAADSNIRIKKFFGAMNGLGLLVAFFAGFGLIAKLGLGFDGWILVKLVIWVVLGGSLAIVNRKPELAIPVALMSIVLGALAAYLAVTKPF